MTRATRSRVYVVGTDTGVGKTTVSCALLRAAWDRKVRVLPFKPAQSLTPGDPEDGLELARAAHLSDDVAAQICPLSFPTPLAPGLVQDGALFLGATPAAVGVRPLERCARALEALEASLDPDFTLIEGAGGLWVPMPGGSWQPEWIQTLGTDVVVVGRAGLGTINHTLLTLDLLIQRGLKVLGFYLCEVDPPDASNPLNPQVIVHARGVPHLGTLAHGRAHEHSLLPPLLRALGREV